MPVIAVAPCSSLHDYQESVRRAGAEVHVLDLSRDTPAEVIGTYDGILLTGGHDVLPSLYGEAADPTFEAAEEGRDDFELELARRALEADVPLLAICRGIQVLNVARGGTLIQDLPGHPAVLESRVTIAHEVWIGAGTMLEQLMGSEACPVNSRHHQAVKDVGVGLIVSATAPDGVVEAIEDPSRRFCVGVQWHPENFYRTGEFRALFEGLVAAAGRP
jgi:putative glutamine amidotransferase